MFQNNAFLKSVASALCLLLIWTDLARAAEQARVHLPSAQKTKSSQAAHPAFTLPARLGAIQEQSDTNKKPKVFIIQDAHSLYSAQASIEKIFLYLLENQWIDGVFLEGASRDLDPTLLKAFPDKRTLKKTLHEFMQRGELSGAASAAILHPGNTLWHGIENESLYQQAAQLYISAREKQHKLQKQLKLFEEALNQKKNFIYPKDYKEIEEILFSYYSKKENFIETLSQLSKYQTPNRFPHLKSILDLYDNQDKRVIEIPNPEKIRVEFQAYVDEVRQSYLLSDEAKHLAFQTKQARLLQDLLVIKLSREDHHWLKESFQRQRESNELSKIYLQAKAARLFYENSELREESFLNYLKAALHTKESFALLSGGFHTRLFSSYLKSKNIPYTVITPAIHEKDFRSTLYENIMLGNISWKPYLRIHKGKWNWSEAFHQHFIHTLLENTPKPNKIASLRLWKFNLIKELKVRGNFSLYKDYLQLMLRAQNTPEDLKLFTKEGHTRIDQFFDILQRNQGTDSSLNKFFTMSHAVPLAGVSQLQWAHRAPPLQALQKEKTIRSEVRIFKKKKKLSKKQAPIKKNSWEKDFEERIRSRFNQLSLLTFWHPLSSYSTKVKKEAFVIDPRKGLLREVNDVIDVYYRPLRKGFLNQRIVENNLVRLRLNSKPDYVHMLALFILWFEFEKPSSLNNLKPQAIQQQLRRHAELFWADQISIEEALERMMTELEENAFPDRFLGILEPILSHLLLSYKKEITERLEKSKVDKTHKLFMGITWRNTLSPLFRFKFRKFKPKYFFYLLSSSRLARLSVSEKFWGLLGILLGGFGLGILFTTTFNFFFKPVYESFVFRQELGIVRPEGIASIQNYRLSSFQIPKNEQEYIGYRLQNVLSFRANKEYSSPFMRLYFLERILTEIPGEESWRGAIQFIRHIINESPIELTHDEISPIATELFRKHKTLSTSPWKLNLTLDVLRNANLKIRARKLKKNPLSLAKKPEIPRAQHRHKSQLNPLRDQGASHRREQAFFDYLENLGIEELTPMIKFAKENVRIKFSRATANDWWLDGGILSFIKNVSETRGKKQTPELMRYDLENKTLALRQTGPEFLNAIAFVKFLSFAFKHHIIPTKDYLIYIPDPRLKKILTKLIKTIAVHILYGQNYASVRERYEELALFILSAPVTLFTNIYSYDHRFIFTPDRRNHTRRQAARSGVLVLTRGMVHVRAFLKSRESFLALLYYFLSNFSFASKIIIKSDQPEYPQHSSASSAEESRLSRFIKSSLAKLSKVIPKSLLNQISRLKALIPLAIHFSSFFFNLSFFLGMYAGVFLFFDFTMVDQAFEVITDFLRSIPLVGAFFDFIFNWILWAWEIFRESINWILEKILGIKLDEIILLWRGLLQYLEPFKEKAIEYLVPFFFYFVLPTISLIAGLIMGYGVHRIRQTLINFWQMYYPRIGLSYFSAGILIILGTLWLATNVLYPPTHFLTEATADTFPGIISSLEASWNSFLDGAFSNAPHQLKNLMGSLSIRDGIINGIATLGVVVSLLLGASAIFFFSFLRERLVFLWKKLLHFNQKLWLSKFAALNIRLFVNSVYIWFYYIFWSRAALALLIFANPIMDLKTIYRVAQATVIGIMVPPIQAAAFLGIAFGFLISGYYFVMLPIYSWLLKKRVLKLFTFQLP